VPGQLHRQRAPDARSGAGDDGDLSLIDAHPISSSTVAVQTCATPVTATAHGAA
jgi:hypothetical protein